MAWSQCRESQCACVHRSDGAAIPPRAGYVIDSDVDEEVNKCVWHRSYSCRALEIVVVVPEHRKEEKTLGIMEY